MRKLKQKVERLDRRVRKIQEDADDRLTADDIAAIKEAKEDLRTGKTLRIA